MADLIPDINNPTVNSKTDDHSSVDQSHNITVAGDYVASNSNNSEMTKKQNQAHPWWTVVICCSMMFAMWLDLQRSLDKNRFEEKTEIQSISHTLEMTTRDAENVHKLLSQNLEQAKLDTRNELEVAKKQAKEGTIWLLRDDIIKTIEFFEATKTITQKQYKRLKDEYNYYVSIGGNHDVKDRYDNFCMKVLAREVQLVETLADKYHPER